MEYKPSFTHGNATTYLKSLRCERIQFSNGISRDYIKVVSGNNKTRTMFSGYLFPVSKSVFRTVKQRELLDPLLMAIDTRSEPDEDEDDGLQESTHNTPAPSPSPIALFIENNRRKEESLVVDKYSKNLKQKEPTNVAPGKKVAPKKNSAKESDADKNNPKKE